MAALFFAGGVLRCLLWSRSVPVAGASTVADLPSKSALAGALAAAGAAHHDYEKFVLKGVRDELWAGFYAAFALGRLGEFTAASRLAALLEEVDTADDWAPQAAEHVLNKLRS